MQKWTQIILPDADITIASLNSLRDLALDFIIVIFIFSFAGRQLYQASVYGNSRWPKHTRKRIVKKKFTGNHRHRIRTGLVFSEDHWVCWKTVGNLLWNYYRGCVRKTQMWQIRTGLKSPSTSVRHKFL